MECVPDRQRSGGSGTLTRVQLEVRGPWPLVVDMTLDQGRV